MPDGPTYVTAFKVPTRGGRIVVNMPTPVQLAAGVQPKVEGVEDPIEVPPPYLDLADEVEDLLGYFASYELHGTRQDTKLGRRIQRLRKAMEALA